VKITIINGAFLPVPALRGGAVEKRWLRMGQEFVRKGHQVTQLSRLSDGLPSEEIIDGVMHKRVAGFDTPSSLLHLKLCDLIYSRRIKRMLLPSDIVVTNTFWLPFLLRNESHWGRIVVDFARMPRGQVRFYRHLSCLRANSAAVHAAIKREYPPIEPRLQLIPNPLPFDPPAPPDLAAKEKMILYAGRIHPEKGLDLLTRAWRKIHPQFPEWTLEMAGPCAHAEGGGGEAFQRNLQKNCGEAPTVWHGPVHNPTALSELYRRASIFAYPSVAEKGETFGLAPLEAAAFGAVPVLSALECFREFAQPGKNASIFDHRSSEPITNLVNCLQSLMENSAQRQAMAREAAAGARKFAPNKIATQFLELFEKWMKV
jgi:glycosyltransferase involved in cell wall biosynthesis